MNSDTSSAFAANSRNFPPGEAMEVLVKNLRATQNNAELLLKGSATINGRSRRQQFRLPRPIAVIVESTGALVAFPRLFCRRLTEGRRCAVDTEADSLHSYREKLCLIQFSCAGRHVIIDPLQVSEPDAPA